MRTENKVEILLLLPGLLLVVFICRRENRTPGRLYCCNIGTSSCVSVAKLKPMRGIYDCF